MRTALEASLEVQRERLELEKLLGHQTLTVWSALRWTVELSVLS